MSTAGGLPFFWLSVCSGVCVESLLLAWILEFA